MDDEYAPVRSSTPRLDVGAVAALRLPGYIHNIMGSGS